MSAEFSDRSCASCPICKNATVAVEGTALEGLLVCPSCGSRLVVSGSGHFVRDPFRWNARVASKLLRHQSHPLARLMRDSGFTPQSSVLVVFVSLLLLGITAAYSGSFSKMVDQLPKLEQMRSDPPPSPHP